MSLCSTRNGRLDKALAGNHAVQLPAPAVRARRDGRSLEVPLAVTAAACESRLCHRLTSSHRPKTLPGALRLGGVVGRVVTLAGPEIR